MVGLQQSGDSTGINGALSIFGYRCFFFAILTFHVLLHWRWIAGSISGRKTEDSGLRLGLGLIGVLTLIAFAAAPLIAPVEISGVSGKRLRSMESEVPAIRGDMSPADIEQTTGVPAEYLFEKLNLPASIDRTVPLGRLRKQHGFSMAEVKKAVIDYRE